jgi:hypothetical protein
LLELFELTLNRAPSPPRFSEGEKVAEGRMRGLWIVAAMLTRAHLFATAPSSGFATFSPTKGVGEKALDGSAR